MRPRRPTTPMPLYDLCPTCEAKHGDCVEGGTNAEARRFVEKWKPLGTFRMFRCVRCLKTADEIGAARPADGEVA